ncbi:MAG: methionine aminotransferase [Bacteroidetes bacterium]|nr:methionine aminotransferase [Bacteroidota bacterium]
MLTSTVNITSKLPHVGTTIFTIMSGLANECNAINLSQGFPNFAVSPALIELINKSMCEGMNQYSSMPGLITLREAIAKKTLLRFGAQYNPETEITITSGGTQALFTAIMATVSKGDEVIIFDPAYDSYAPAVELAGGVPIHIALMPPNFNIDWNEVQQTISPQTRMIIINNPGNPSSQVLTKDDMIALQKITDGTNIIVLSDEVYEHIIFDGQQHQSVSMFPQLAARSLVVYSFGKTFHATGWKMGYILGPQMLMTEFRKVHQFNVFSANTPIQAALSVFLSDENNYNYLEKFFAQKRDYFASMLLSSRFKILPCCGSYFQLLDYSAITNEHDKDYAIRMTKENGVASIPVSAFYKNGTDNKLLRFCFAKDDATLQAAAERLCKI